MPWRISSGSGRVRGDEGRRRDDLRGAEAALHGVGPDERLHERVVTKALDRRHLAVADRVHEREHESTGTPSSWTVHAPQ